MQTSVRKILVSASFIYDTKALTKTGSLNIGLKKKTYYKNMRERERSPLTGHIQQVFQDFDCPKLPKSISYSRQGTAKTFKTKTVS